MYTVDQINAYLDKIKGKPVPLEQYFLDLEKFVMTVIKVRKTVGYDILYDILYDIRQKKRVGSKRSRKV